MANRFAVASGNWNSSSVWADTPSGTPGAEFVPGSGDVAMANGFTITINVNATCSEIRNDTTGGATSGGIFFGPASGNVTITANLVGGSATRLVLIDSNGNHIYLVGDVHAGNAGTESVLLVNQSANVTVTGNVYGGAGVSAIILWNVFTGLLQVIGNVYGGTASGYAYGIEMQVPGRLTVIGDVTGGVGTGYCRGINLAIYGIPEISVGGNVSGGAGAGSIGLYLSDGGVTTIEGNVIAGVGQSAYGVTGQNAIGTVTIHGSVISNNYPNDGLVYPVVGLYVLGTSHLSVGGLKTGTGGLDPIDGPIDKRRVFFATGGVQSAYLYDGNEGNLVSLSNVDADHPAVADVRAGVHYYQGNRVGTCAVPPAAAVGVGVPVGATIGQAALTQADIAAVVGPIWIAG